MTQTPTSPGWYDDPDDPSLLRYFDGVVWTAHTAPRRSPTAEQSTIGRVPAPLQASSGPGGPAHPQRPHGPAPSVPHGPPWTTRRDVLPDGAILAEWWRRLLARLLDALLTGLLTTVFAWSFLQDLAAAFGRYLTDVVDAAERGGAAPSQTAFSAAVTDLVVPLTVISVLVAVAYEVSFLVWRGATPGKMALGTVVRRVSSPGRLSVATAARRQAISVGANLVGLVPFVGVLGSVVSIVDPAWLLWDPRRQALHDKVADTVVVLRRRP